MRKNSVGYEKNCTYMVPGGVLHQYSAMEPRYSWLGIGLNSAFE